MEDQHSPCAFCTSIGGILRAPVHSHVGWFFAKAPPPRQMMDKYLPELLADPNVPFVSSRFGWWAGLGQVIPDAIGLAVTQTWLGALMAWIWGGLFAKCKGRLTAQIELWPGARSD